jgi:glycine cleavage system H protein
MDNIRNFMGHLWVMKEDNVYTIGLNEEALEDFDEIESIDLPTENENVEEDSIIGAIETNDGPLDIYTPVTGTILEVNQAAADDPSLIIDDPTGDGWLVKIESSDDLDEDEDDEDDDDDDEDEDEEEDED